MVANWKCLFWGNLGQLDQCGEPGPIFCCYGPAMPHKSLFSNYCCVFHLIFFPFLCCNQVTILGVPFSGCHQLSSCSHLRTFILHHPFLSVYWEWKQLSRKFFCHCNRLKHFLVKPQHKFLRLQLRRKLLMRFLYCITSILFHSCCWECATPILASMLDLLFV